MTTNVMDNSWKVAEFIGNSTDPKAITRLKDGKTFAIGDYVTNGTQMRGHIQRFEYSFKGGSVYVYTDWSGVGMNFESIDFKDKLPSAHQPNDRVSLEFASAGRIEGCKVVKVHFTESKVQYDVEVSAKHDDPSVGTWATRLYNVDSAFVTKAA